MSASLEPDRTALLEGFPPISAPSAAVLILGSMPGAESLRHRQYYAHPRNAFWPIMSSLLSLPPQASYEARCEGLRAHRIALWDVLKHCIRPGSLDANIVAETVRVNDFAAFFAVHPGIGAVLFNGATAEQAFRRQVLPGLPTDRRLRLLRLPSTSPAHAGMRPAEKLARWRDGLAGGFSSALPHIQEIA